MPEPQTDNPHNTAARTDGAGAGSARSPEPYNATITAWSEQPNGRVIFRVQPDDGPVHAFEPGQFATLGLPREHPPVEDPDRYPPGDPRWKKLWRREYSIASSAHERQSIELYAVHVSGGRFTPRLWHAAQHGRRIWMDLNIKGDFTLRRVPSNDRHLVLVATGTGICPYVSMLRTYRGTGRWHRFTLIHGVRRAEDLGYREELESIAAADPTVDYFPVCSREPADSPFPGHRGRVNELIEPEAFRRTISEPLDPERCHVFLCGNPEMIQTCREPLEQLGFVVHSRARPGNLHFERYW